MIVRIQKLQPLPNYKLKVIFDDGKKVLYDVFDDINTISCFEALAHEPGLFKSVQLDESRTCVFWNDAIDLPSDAIYEHGEEIIAP